MKVKQSLILGVLMALPFAAMAQNSALPDPLDANAPVAPPSYVSTLKTYQRAADSETSPDKSWRAANEEVRKLGGHAGHLKGNGETAPTAQQADSSRTSRTHSHMAPMQMDHRQHHQH